MGFRNGSGSEKLLNCFACHEPMAIDAEFCSECGVRRAVATGYESADQPFEGITDSFKKVGLLSATSGLKNLTKTIGDNQKKVASNLRKVSRIRFFLGEKLTKFNNVLIQRRKLIFIASGAMFVFSTYVLTQTLIFSTQKTDSFAEKYINLVSSRDSSEVKMKSIYFPNPENLPIIPAKFQSWNEIEQITWKTDSTWNGWFGDAVVRFSPILGQKVDYEKAIEVNLSANFKSKWLIFREIDWVASLPMASIEIGPSIEKDQSISFNGTSAGNSNSPILSKKKYAIFPGPISIVLNGNGFTKERTFNAFVSSAGLVKTEFEKIDYGLSSAQQSAARSKVISELNSCLARECGRLPNLSQSDFSFSNWPDSYLYVDYFRTSWGSSASCETADYIVSTYQTARISMKCSVSASASIKWILYRLFFTTYYDTGFDYKTVELYVTADLSPVKNSTSVRVSGVNITD